jgi:hypothetical protein
VRAAIPAMVLLVIACSGRARPLDDPERWRRGQCVARFTLEHEHAPATEPRERGAAPEGAQDRFPAAVIDPERQPPVAAAASLRLEGRPIAWWSPTLDAIVLDGAAFAPLRRADATAAGGERQVVGRVVPRARRALGDRTVLELLLRIEVIRTYWHVGADLCLAHESTSQGTYHAELEGVHRYVVAASDRGRARRERTVDAPIALVVEIDAEGVVSVLPRAVPGAQG